MAGVTVEESQPSPQRPPVEMAALIASVSSLTPSPVSSCQSEITDKYLEEPVENVPLAPKSFTLRKI
jgi:hypothetical protein